MTNHLTLNSTSSLSVLATPVLHGATATLTHHPMSMNLPMNASATLVSHGAAGPSKYYLPMIDLLQHVDHGVTINDSSPYIVIPVLYPVTSCVAITTATWTPTTTQSCFLHYTYGAVLAYRPRVHPPPQFHTELPVPLIVICP